MAKTRRASQRRSPPESNTLDVANEVHDIIQQVTPTLPPGGHLEPFFRPSTIVYDSISSVRDARAHGILLSFRHSRAGFLRDWELRLWGLGHTITRFVTSLS